MALSAEALLEYACEKFENQCYDEALEAFVLAYDKGYEQEWILENIYNCYIGANEQEFLETYKKGKKGEIVPYEQCLLDFVPYKEGKYYIFDKELNIFRGIYEIPNQKDREDDSLKELEFSSLALGIEWNLTKWNAAIAEVRNRKVYIVCEDIRRGISFCKIPELAEYMRDVTFCAGCDSFENYFHENTSIYLPKAFAGDERIKSGLIEIVNREHKYRLTPEGRNIDNILLTIGIPTHDRGHLLLKRLENLLPMQYDAEIEIAIAKNGLSYFQEEYKEVEKIRDSRINYIGVDRELKLTENWQNVFKISSGRFVMLVSDEDDVIVPELEYYLKFLSIHGDLGVVRPKTAYQCSSILENSYYKKGIDAFKGGFLKNNYLSGMIFNREKFINLDINKWDIIFGENEFYKVYPHQWWQAIMSFEGDFSLQERCIIQEGDSVLQEEYDRYEADKNERFNWAREEGYSELTFVSTYEGRIKQFIGAVELIGAFDKLDLEMKAQALVILINKTLYLMDLVRVVYHYKEEEFPQAVESLIEEMISAMNMFCITVENQKAILEGVYKYINKIDSETVNK